jgi:hypothetical protein
MNFVTMPLLSTFAFWTSKIYYDYMASSSSCVPFCWWFIKSISFSIYILNMPKGHSQPSHLQRPKLNHDIIYWIDEENESVLFFWMSILRNNYDYQSPCDKSTSFA